MGLNKYRNKPCQCGSGMKFKFCCLQDHYKQQTGLVTRLAKKIHEKTAKYWRKRYKTVTDNQSQESCKPAHTVCIKCDNTFLTDDYLQRLCPNCQQK